MVRTADDHHEYEKSWSAFNAQIGVLEISLVLVLVHIMQMKLYEFIKIYVEFSHHPPI